MGVIADVLFTGVMPFLGLPAGFIIGLVVGLRMGRKATGYAL